MIEGVGGRSGGSRAVGDHKRSSTARAGRWSERSLFAVAGLFALFLGLPVLSLVVRAVLDGSLSEALTTQVVLDALVLSLITTSISLAITLAYQSRKVFPAAAFFEALTTTPAYVAGTFAVSGISIDVT